MTTCEACGNEVHQRRKCPDCEMMVCGPCRWYGKVQGYFCTHGTVPGRPLETLIQLEQQGKVKGNRVYLAHPDPDSSLAVRKAG